MPAALRPPADPTVIFVHIPKAGGTTLNRILQRQFPPQSVYRLGVRGPAMERLAAMPPADRARLRLFTGHVGYGLHALLPQAATYVTMLRDPVARVVSGYRYVQRTPEHAHHQAVVAGRMSLTDFVQSGISKILVDNGQTRILSGEPEAGHAIPFGACTPELLARAQANLDKHFAWVGLLERFDESVLLLCED